MLFDVALVIMLGLLIWISIGVSLGDNNILGTALIVSAFYVAAFLIPTLIWANTIADKVGHLTQIEPRVAMVQKQIDILDKKLLVVDLKQEQLTLNADSPIATLIITRKEMVNKLIKYRDKEYKWRGYLMGTKHGFFSRILYYMSVPEKYLN